MQYDCIVLNGSLVRRKDGVMTYCLDGHVVCIDENGIVIDNKHFDYEDNSIYLLGSDHEYVSLVEAIKESLNIIKNQRVAFIIRKMHVLRYGHAYYEACSVLEVVSAVKAGWFLAATISMP